MQQPYQENVWRDMADMLAYALQHNRSKKAVLKAYENLKEIQGQPKSFTELLLQARAQSNSSRSR